MGLFGNGTRHRRKAAPITDSSCTRCGFLPTEHTGGRCPGGDHGDVFAGHPRSGGLARWLPIVPLLVVTGFATYGQTLFGINAYSPSAWPVEQRLAVAIGVAVGLESIGNYVQWHAHDALLMRATSTAARLRRASYLIAFGIAAINYSHFAGPHWSPTPGAVVFAAFSASGPWLWGLHTRRAQRVQLTREGHIDASGATFSAERWRAFPFRTWAARRWSIDHSISDPRKAWESYRTERAARVDRRATHAPPGRLLRAVAAFRDRGATTERDGQQAGQAASIEDVGDGPTLPDRRAAVDTSSVAEICADLRAIAVDVGRPLTQDEVRQVYGIGAGKAGEARRSLGWHPRAVERSTGAVAGG